MKKVNWILVSQMICIIICLSAIIRYSYEGDYKYIHFPIIIIGLCILSIAFAACESTIKSMQEALDYKQSIIDSLSESEDKLSEELDDCQHKNTDESMNTLRLKESLQALLVAIDKLPPLTAIEGVLEDEVNDAKEAILKVETSWGYHKK